MDIYTKCICIIGALAFTRSVFRLVYWIEHPNK